MNKQTTKIPHMLESPDDGRAEFANSVLDLVYRNHRDRKRGLTSGELEGMLEDVATMWRMLDDHVRNIYELTGRIPLAALLKASRPDFAADYGITEAEADEARAGAMRAAHEVHGLEWEVRGGVFTTTDPYRKLTP